MSEPGRSLNFCIIGCGRAAGFHAEVIGVLGHRIIAACGRKNSPNIESFSQTHGVARSYDNWQTMLSLENPDAVVVATPWNETQHLVGEVINSGVPCLVEKPVALHSPTLAKIVEETVPHFERVLVGYNRRFYESVAPIDEGLRRWSLVSIELNLPEATQPLRESYPASVASHMLVYMSSHWFDLLLALIGEVSVLDMYSRKKAGVDHPTAYNGLLWSTRFGAPIHLQSNFDAPSQISITFNFEDRIYRLCPVETLTVYRGLERHRSAGGRLHRYLPRVEQVVHTSEQYKPGFLRQMENFIAACVLRSAPNQDGCTLEGALRVTKLLEEIQTRSKVS